MYRIPEFFHAVFETFCLKLTSSPDTHPTSLRKYSPVMREVSLSDTAAQTPGRRAVIQPEMRLAYWGMMASASPGEKLVSIKDHFKGFGKEAGG